jgi:hypothetical protein
MGSLFGSNQAQTTTSNQTQTPTIPSWLSSDLQSLGNTATTLGGQAYQPYTGSQVAPLNTAQNQAFNMTQGLVGGTQPAFQNAQNITSQVANYGLNGPTQTQLNQYMNPYLNATLDQQQNRDLVNYSQQSNQLQEQQAQTGAFGGSRAAVGQSQLLNNFNLNEQQQQAQAYSGAYNNAQQGVAAGMNTAANSATNMANLASGNQNAAMQQASALLGTGNQQQTQVQQGLDVNYQNYLTQLSWPYQQEQAEESMHF